MAYVLLSVWILMIAGCTPRTASEDLDDPQILGRSVASADAVWMEPYTDDDLGETLRYRELLDPETFIARAGRPVLLVRYDVLDGSGPGLIPRLETLAMTSAASGYVLLIDEAFDDPYLEGLEALTLPAFYLIDQGSVLTAVDGTSTERIQALLDHFPESP